MKREEALKRYYEIMRMMRYSPKTIEAYTDRVSQYISFIAASPAEGSREDRIGSFLTRLVLEKNISAMTQKQALCSIVLFYRIVLKEKIGDLVFTPSSRAKRLPSVFSREEAWRVLDLLDGVGWIWGALMYGCGLRLEEVKRAA